MQINTKNLISMTEANQNFSKVAHLVDENGSAIILKNNAPRYIVIPFTDVEEEDAKIEELALNILNKHRKAFEVLAQ
jgi:antitoxin Phd